MIELIGVICATVKNDILISSFTLPLLYWSELLASSRLSHLVSVYNRPEPGHCLCSPYPASA